MADTLRQRGYIVSGLSANGLGVLFGMHSIPDWFFADISLEEKILRFNQYIYDITNIEKPDIFLIEIPGGIIPYGDPPYNHFSESAHVIGSALEIDFGIFTSYAPNRFQIYQFNDVMERINQYCEARFDIPIDFHVIGRQQYEYDDERKCPRYYFFSDDYLKKLDLSLEVLGGKAMTIFDYAFKEKLNACSMC